MDRAAPLLFVKLSKDAKTPTKGSAEAIGHDLYSSKKYTVPPQDKLICETDIQVLVPKGTYGRIAPRSGLAANYFIDIGAGVIDRDYRGSVQVVIFNHSKVNFEINKGDKICQFICEQAITPLLVRCNSLPSTKRGRGGFGSTDKK